ncbi:MAG: CDP-alcohol phosphatidyltransferase family protein [Actinomycetota bacterium]
MLSDKLRPIIEPVTSGVGRALARAGATPNGLTAAGLLAVVGCSGLIVAGHARLAGVLLIPSVILDVLDGALARATGRVSKWGGYFDSVADRIADAALLGAIAYAAASVNSRLLAAAMGAMVLSFLVSYARAKAEALGFSAAGGPGERPERAAVLIAGLVFNLVEAAVWVIIALALITFVVRCAAVRRQAMSS